MLVVFGRFDRSGRLGSGFGFLRRFFSSGGVMLGFRCLVFGYSGCLWRVGAWRLLRFRLAAALFLLFLGFGCGGFLRGVSCRCCRFCICCRGLGGLVLGLAAAFFLLSVREGRVGGGVRGLFVFRLSAAAFLFRWVGVGRQGYCLLVKYLVYQLFLVVETCSSAMFCNSEILYILCCRDSGGRAPCSGNISNV